MTLDEMKRSDKVMLTTRDVAPVLHISPERLIDQARKNPTFLGFPVVVADRTVRIPRASFVAFVEGRSE